MKSIAVSFFVILFIAGCTTFGAFPNLKKGESSQEEVLSMLGDPAKKTFEGEKEVWQYAFMKKGEKQTEGVRTILNMEVIFKEKEVDDYQLSVSKESVEEGGMKPGQKGKALPAPKGKGRVKGQGPKGKSQRPGQDAKGRTASGDFIQQLDRNNDARVSREEFPGPDQAFNKFDQNGDGFIDEYEAPKGPPPRKGGKGKRQ
jgi:EF hand